MRAGLDAAGHRPGAVTRGSDGAPASCGARTPYTVGPGRGRPGPANVRTRPPAEPSEVRAAVPSPPGLHGHFTLAQVPGSSAHRTPTTLTEEEEPVTELDEEEQHVEVVSSDHNDRSRGWDNSEMEARQNLTDPGARGARRCWPAAELTSLLPSFTCRYEEGLSGHHPQEPVHPS